MYVQSLKLTNVRAIDTASLRFAPGFNLVVGVNGVGKTTVLDALSWALSFIVRDVNRLKTATREPLGSDIRFGASALTVECGVSINEGAHTYLLHQPADDAGVAHQGEGKPREQTHAVTSRREFIGEGPRRVGKDPAKGRPLAVLFSTRRAAAVRAGARSRRAVGGAAAAYAEVLEDREFGLAEFADWMRAQGVLAEERPQSQRLLDALEAATRRFLPGYQNLRPLEDAKSAQRSAAAAAAAAAGAANAAAESATAKPDAVMSSVVRAAQLAAEAAGHASRTSLLLIDRGQAELVLVDDLTDADLASVRHAIQRADNWLALHWTGEHLGENVSADALGEDRRLARATQIEDELARLIPTCRNLQPNAAGQPDALIERLPTTVPVTQLSDGERGTLAMVLDLTRRLAQANPHLADPAAEAEAVVLIDEIDLHLHPRWQREIIHSLTSTFPKCQFIATTHSPQVISEVGRDRVQIMHADGVYFPSHSFGIDSSRILEELMGVSPHPKVIQEKLKQISELSRPDTLAEARAALDELAAILELGESDPEVTRLRTLLDFLEDA